MNSTQTHKVFGQGVRSMLAVAIAASAISTVSVKAGPTEEIIADAMNDTGIVTNVTSKSVKQKDQTWQPPDAFNQAMIASFAITFTQPSSTGLNSKVTASKLFTFYQKGLPEFSPTLVSFATAAALDTNLGLKYKDNKARVKDIAKIASFGIKNGMKAYKKGTRNSGWTGFTSVNPATIENNIANVAYQATIAIAAQDDSSIMTQAIADVTKALVKATSKFKKSTQNGPASAMLGFIANVADGQDQVNSLVTGIVQIAVKNAKKDYLTIANAAAYAAYAVFLQKNPGTEVTAEEWAEDNQGAIYTAILNGYGKKAADFQQAIFDQVGAGATAAATPGTPAFGAGYLSNEDGLLAINDGKPGPVTKIQN